MDSETQATLLDLLLRNFRRIDLTRPQLLLVIFLLDRIDNEMEGSFRADEMAKKMGQGKAGFLIQFNAIRDKGLLHTKGGYHLPRRYDLEPIFTRIDALEQ